MALHLNLLVHAGRQLLFLDHDTVSPTHTTGIDVAIRRPSTAALLADLLLIPLKLRHLAIIEVSQCDVDLQLQILAPSLAGLATKVSLATKHAAEKVKWVVGLEAAALFVALETLVAILVVDLAGVLGGECFVGFRYFDELRFGGAVAGVLIWMVLLG
jgi:hypothetical protein